MTPTVIPFGDIYYAVIKMPCGEEIVVEDERGRNIKFETASRAMNAARAVIADLEAPALALQESVQHDAEQHEMVRVWNQERLDRLEADRQMAALMGVKVVTKKRKRIPGREKQ